MTEPLFDVFDPDRYVKFAVHRCLTCWSLVWVEDVAAHLEWHGLSLTPTPEES